MLQKHKWSKLLHAHPDLKAHWESLPRTKAGVEVSNKKSKRKSMECETLKEEEQHKEEEKSLFGESSDDNFGDNISLVIKEETMTIEKVYENKNKDKEEFEVFMNELKTLDFSEIINLTIDCSTQEGFCMSNENTGFDNLWEEWKKRSTKLTMCENQNMFF